MGTMWRLLILGCLWVSLCLADIRTHRPSSPEPSPTEPCQAQCLAHTAPGNNLNCSGPPGLRYWCVLRHCNKVCQSTKIWRLAEQLLDKYPLKKRRKRSASRSRFAKKPKIKRETPATVTPPAAPVPKTNGTEIQTTLEASAKTEPAPINKVAAESEINVLSTNGTNLETKKTKTFVPDTNVESSSESVNASRSSQDTTNNSMSDNNLSTSLGVNNNATEPKASIPGNKTLMNVPNTNNTEPEDDSSAPELPDLTAAKETSETTTEVPAAIKQTGLSPLTLRPVASTASLPITSSATVTSAESTLLTIDLPNPTKPSSETTSSLSMDEPITNKSSTSVSSETTLSSSMDEPITNKSSTAVPSETTLSSSMDEPITNKSSTAVPSETTSSSSMDEPITNKSSTSVSSETTLSSSMDEPITNKSSTAVSSETTTSSAMDEPITNKSSTAVSSETTLSSSMDEPITNKSSTAVSSETTLSSTKDLPATTKSSTAVSSETTLSSAKDFPITTKTSTVVDVPITTKSSTAVSSEKTPSSNIDLPTAAKLPSPVSSTTAPRTSTDSTHGADQKADNDEDSFLNVAGEVTKSIQNTSVLLAVLMLGIMFFLAIISLLLMQAYKSYKRKDYTPLDYLINGMYADSEF